MPVCQRARSPLRSFSRTCGLCAILRTYPAFMPCSATIQNEQRTSCMLYEGPVFHTTQVRSARALQASPCAVLLRPSQTAIGLGAVYLQLHAVRGSSGPRKAGRGGSHAQLRSRCGSIGSAGRLRRGGAKQLRRQLRRKESLTMNFVFFPSSQSPVPIEISVTAANGGSLVLNLEQICM